MLNRLWKRRYQTCHKAEQGLCCARGWKVWYSGVDKGDGTANRDDLSGSQTIHSISLRFLSLHYQHRLRIAGRNSGLVWQKCSELYDFGSTVLSANPEHGISSSDVWYENATWKKLWE